MNIIDISFRKVNKLPSLHISTIRSTSAKLHNASKNENYLPEDQTPYFKHSRNQTNSMDPNPNQDISMLCQDILREQKELKQKITQQEKLLRKITFIV